MADPKINDKLKDQLDITRELEDLAKKHFKNTANREAVLKSVNDLERSIKDSNEKQTRKQEVILNVQKGIHRVSKEIRQEYESNIINHNKIIDLTKKLGILKQKELELAKERENVESQSAAWLQFGTAIGLGKAISLTNELKKSWEKHPMLGTLITVSAIITGFLSVFREVDGAASNFRRTMGFVRGSTDKLEQDVRRTYFSLAHTGVEAKDLYQSFQDVSKVIGSSRYATIGMASDMSLMAASLGVAQETSAEFLKVMGMMARNTMDSQTNIAIFTSKLSEAAGTNLNEVMSDIANATKSSYQFMTRSPLALSKAAIEAKKMGTSLQDSAKSAGTLIKFQESVKAEMEASVLLGESINLQRARELSYRRDMKGLNAEILDIANKTHFEDLDSFQQEAVANALGKSSEEVGKMLQAQREMSRIRGDRSLSKEIAEYDRLRNANELLVESEAKSSRYQLQLKSNLEATAAISKAVKSIFQSLLAPLIDLGVVVLPPIATYLSKVNQLFNQWGPLGKIIAVASSAAILLFGAKGIGKLISWVSGGLGKGIGGFFGGISDGVKKFGGTDVIKGAAGIFLVAASLVPLAYGLKLMQGVEWKTFFVMAASLAVLTGAVLLFGKITVAAWPVILAGAGAIAIMGAAMIPAAYAFQLFSKGIKSLAEVDLLSIADGLMAIVPPLGTLATMSIMFPLAAAGITLFGMAIRTMVGPVERMGIASKELGMGLSLAAQSLGQIANLGISNTISQFKSLSKVIQEINKIITEMPDIKLEKLQSIIVKTGEISSNQAQKSNEEIINALIEVKSSINALKSSLEKGGIPAIVYIDSTRFDSGVARSLAFRGPVSPQPSTF